MHYEDTAHTLPVSGNMSGLNKAFADDAGVIVHPAQKQIEGQKTLPRILVVEDDASLANLEAGVLAAHGYTVAIANNGELAITALHRFAPDLVVLDLELAGPLNGWDVLQVLRAYATTPVLLTTSSVTAIRKYIRSRGETRLTLDHLSKPYPMQTLLKRIRRMLMIAPQ